jgi:hypothetical protein
MEAATMIKGVKSHTPTLSCTYYLRERIRQLILITFSIMVQIITMNTTADIAQKG